MKRLSSIPLMISSLAIGGITVTPLWSQTDTLQMDVTFIGNRQMEVRDAVKLSSWPTAWPLSMSKPALSYELLSKRLQFEPSMTPIKATRLRVDPALSRLYRGYVRAAAGTRGTTLVDASFTDLRSRDGSWGTAFHHNATNGPSSLLTGRLKDNSLDAWVSRFVGKEKISFQVHAGQNQVLMYGFDSLRVDSALTPNAAPTVVWSHAMLATKLKSHKTGENDFNHEVDIQLGWLGNNLGAHERTLGVSANAHRALANSKGNWMSIFSLTNTGQRRGIREPSGCRRRAQPVYPQRPLNINAGLGLAIDADQPTRDGVGDSFICTHGLNCPSICCAICLYPTVELEAI